MAKLSKKPNNRKLSSSREPLSNPAFDDEEPLGEDFLEEEDTADGAIAMPPLTLGKDSTKPTAFDKLPWKQVQIPEFIGDGIALEADGGMLGLEELDGSVWNDLKSKNASHNKVSSESQSHEDTIAELQNQSSTLIQESETNHALGKNDAPSDPKTEKPDVIDKLARKKAKKERLAALRKLKKSSCLDEIGNLEGLAKHDQCSGSREENDFSLNDVDWSAVAEIDDFNEIDEDVDPLTHSYSFDQSLLSNWRHINLTSPLKSALHSMSFNNPTPVQEESLKFSLSQTPPRDLVVIAETGSGKTLSYGLPIINHLMISQTNPPIYAEEHDTIPISALILTPTRELCLQVKKHLDTFLGAMCSPGRSKAEDGFPKNRSGISVVAICGGIAAVKQRKQLEMSKKLVESGKGGRGCVVVATPGRLWDLIQSWDPLARSIQLNLNWLVIDEADKMIERGHFEELEKILKMTRRPRKAQEGEWKDDWVGQPSLKVKEDIRTMVFSATMDKNLQINLKKGRKASTTAPANPIQDLLEHIDFRDESPELIDLTPQGKTVEGLKECKIECLLKDKDLYLFHFLLRYSGRTIVFLSSIAALRRLAPIFTLLLPHSKVLPLHSEMKQKARLKSLERFRSASQSVLLSTDVAARGLDIPFVDHVVHYQVPRTVDCYIHRSGRTARAGREGVALVLVGPDEVKVWRSLVKSLGRVDGLPSPPIAHSITQKLKELLELAKKIDTVEHQCNKKAYEENWFKKAAEMMEVDFDESKYDSEEEENPTSQRPLRASNSLSRQLRAELQEKLADPIVIGGTVVKQTKKRTRPMGNCYITDPSLLEKLLKGESHEKVLGLDKQVRAVEEIDRAKRKRK